MTTIRERNIARLWANAVADGSGCWLWQGHLTRGYGTMRRGGGKRVRVHRVAYEAVKGPIPDGLKIDHLCRVRNCVNPAHLEAVTQAENNRRGIGWAGVNAQKTHCVRGHEFTDENTYVRPDSGNRACRACQRSGS